jgi:hypothetical protein
MARPSSGAGTLIFCVAIPIAHSPTAVWCGLRCTPAFDPEDLRHQRAAAIPIKEKENSVSPPAVQTGISAAQPHCGHQSRDLGLG